MLHVATCLWDANRHTMPNSGHYDETWVEKLFAGFRRNLTVPFRAVCFVDRKRNFSEGIEQMHLSSSEPGYGNFTEPYGLNEPMILVGLDTVVVGNIDHFARYCLEGDKVALPRDFRHPDRSINGVALVPKGHRHIADDWAGQNDMEWLRQFPWQPINDKWPGQVLSYKMNIRWRGDLLPEGTRIVYFHGRPKPDTLGHIDWVRENWR